MELDRQVFLEGIAPASSIWEAATGVGCSWYCCLCAELQQPDTLQLPRSCQRGSGVSFSLTWTHKTAVAALSMTSER